MTIFDRNQSPESAARLHDAYEQLTQLMIQSIATDLKDSNEISPTVDRLEIEKAIHRFLRFRTRHGDGDRCLVEEYQQRERIWASAAAGELSDAELISTIEWLSSWDGVRSAVELGLPLMIQREPLIRFAIQGSVSDSMFFERAWVEDVETRRQRSYAMQAQSLIHWNREDLARRAESVESIARANARFIKPLFVSFGKNAPSPDREWQKGIERVVKVEANRLADHRALITRLAILRFRGRFNTWPETLDDLVETQILTSLPVNPVTGRPLVYGPRSIEWQSPATANSNALQPSRSDRSTTIEPTESESRTPQERWLWSPGWRLREETYTDYVKKPLQAYQQVGIGWKLVPTAYDQKYRERRGDWPYEWHPLRIEDVQHLGITWPLDITSDQPRSTQ